MLPFVPIPAPQRESGPPASGPADRQGDAPPRLRTQMPPPVQENSPLSFWREAAFVIFDEEPQMTYESPLSTQATTDAGAPAEVETLGPPEPLVTPIAPPHTPTPQDAPPAPTQLSREKTASASRRRLDLTSRRLDLTSHKEVK